MRGQINVHSLRTVNGSDEIFKSWQVVLIESKLPRVDRTDLRYVSNRLQFVPKLLVSKRLCIETTGNREYLTHA